MKEFVPTSRLPEACGRAGLVEPSLFAAAVPRAFEQEMGSAYAVPTPLLAILVVLLVL